MLRQLSQHSWRPVLMGVLAALLFGCAALQVAMYVPPSGDDTAQLEFVNLTAAPINAFIYGDATECRHRELLNMAIPVNHPVAVRVDSTKELAVLVFNADIMKVCRLTLSFKPEKNKNYRFYFRGTPEKCGGTVMEMADGGEYTRVVPISVRKFVEAFDETGHWCEAKQ